MQLFLLSCLVANVVAELPRFRPARFRSQRLELVPTTTDTPPESTTDFAGYPPAGGPAVGGPYPPSGWKPAGQPFALPERRPATGYGAPEKASGVPDNAYGTPTDAPSTTAPQVEKLEGPVEVLKSVDNYYVLLPNGQLQRVQFVTENDVQNMKYTARLELRDRAPLYVFRS